MKRPPARILVESLLGSQPTCITVCPLSLSAADRFEAIVLFPMPPFPYIAICLMLFTTSPRTVAPSNAIP